MTTLKEGNMFKRGVVNTDWKLRTFVLNKNLLSYFKRSHASPAGSISLADIKEITPFDATGEFNVITEKRVYTLKGATREEGIEWRQAIIDICLETNVKLKI